MSRLVAAVALAVVLTAPAAALAVDGPATGVPAGEAESIGPASPDLPDGPALVAVHPNPVPDEDRGEFVVVRFPPNTSLAGWRLADGEDSPRLPNRTVGGRVALSPEPATARNLTDRRVLPLGDLSLTNGGETVRLRYRNATVDSLAYPDAPEGETYENGSWRPLGATDFSSRTTTPAEATTFVLPDAPGVPLSTLRDADRRILLAGYTFESRRVARTLRAAHARGVRVRVLVDAAPVGGMTRREARLLDGLVAAGVPVRVSGGPHARYAFHHPKYAVVDDRALVLTENWEPAGTGGHASRGWGVVVRGEETAADLAAVFRADAGWRDAIPWTRYRVNETFQPSSPATADYPTRFRPRSVPVESARLLVAPDNAERELVSLVRSADDSLLVEQATLGDRNGTLARETLAAARRGVRVRVLLSGAWYSREENRNVTAWLNERARVEGLDLRARLAEPRGRFEKVHAKGVVVDGEQVVVGSINWNDHALRENREVAVLLRGEAVAGYYARAFRADWRGGVWWLSPTVAGAVLVAAAVALAVARRRVTFTPREAPPP